MTLNNHHRHLCQAKQWMKQKYIGNRSSLLELFTHCPSCHNTSTGEVAYAQGTFIAIKQHCVHCEQQRQWTSQPCIKDPPAENILLSAAMTV